MDGFAVLVVGGLAVALFVFLALGRYYPGSGAEQVDWRPTRSPELEAELESHDIEQMIEAQNERRRRAGRREITEADVRAKVEEGARWRAEEAARYAAEHGEEDAPA